MCPRTVITLKRIERVQTADMRKQTLPFLLYQFINQSFVTCLYAVLLQVLLLSTSSSATHRRPAGGMELGSPVCFG